MNTTQPPQQDLFATTAATEAATQEVAQEPVVGNRQATMDCVAKAIRAFLLCNTLSIKDLMLKADISERTAFRVVDCLLKERLIAREPGMEVRLRRVYRWNPAT